MTRKEQLHQEGSAIARQLGVNKLYATSDGQFFREESYAQLHKQTKGVEKYVLEYGDVPSGSSPTKTQPKKKAEPAKEKAEPKEPTLDAVVARIKAAKNASQLAAAVPEGDVRNEVMKAAAEKRKELVAASKVEDKFKPEDQEKETQTDDLTEVKGVGKATAGKLEKAGLKTIKALAEADAGELAKETKVRKALLSNIIAEAKKHIAG